MCGIVGYLGDKNVKDVLVEGLRTLEYRGYDSAGISVFNSGKIEKVRAAGKLKSLVEKLVNKEFNGKLGIAHTRWATHGKPTERNAHPHTVNKISLVHNGIIENYMELKEQLVKEGAVISSDTDTELMAHLISKEVDSGKDLYNAIKTVKTKIHGAYAVLVMSEDQPEEIIGFKYGPPLIVGLGEGEVVFASDVQAIAPHTKKVFYLEDEDVVLAKKNSLKIFRSEKEILPEWAELDWSKQVAEKSGYEHFMLKEIFEQPRAFAAAIDPHISVEDKTVTLNNIDQNDLKNISRIFIVACGTSYYSGMYGEYVIEKLAGVPVELEIASEFRYKEPFIPEDSLVIVISQSGETADTLAALRLAKEKGAKVLSLCNTKNSTIDREADFNLYMNSGVEVGVASTKAFISSLGVMVLIAVQLAKIKGQLKLEEEKIIVESLLGLPSVMESVLAYDKFFAKTADDLKKFKGFLYMGRGTNYPIALEGALKMKELAYKHAEGYAAGEMKHGPLALIDEEILIFMLCPQDHLYEKTLSNLEEAKARGGYIVSVGTKGDKQLEELSEHFLALPKGDFITTPILETIPVQLVSYHVAKALGCDVDQPRNLAKSVTVE